MTTREVQGVSPGPPVKMIVTYRMIWVGGKVYSEGDVVMMTENDARIAIGVGRARRFEPAKDGVPPPVVEPEPVVKRTRGKKKQEE
jgi:hypothetical protein